MSTVSWGTALDDVWSRALNFLDYSIDDAFGQLSVPTWNPFGVEGSPEQTVPDQNQPVDTGGNSTNKTVKYAGIGLLVLGGAYLVYKAVK